jgi:tRNA U34 5-methylaminomethyl-2-thiouridine-forming methyltransferase MnmC
MLYHGADSFNGNRANAEAQSTCDACAIVKLELHTESANTPSSTLFDLWYYPRPDKVCSTEKVTDTGSATLARASSHVSVCLLSMTSACFVYMLRLLILDTCVPSMGQLLAIRT